MRNDPLLAVRRLPPGNGYKVPRTFKVEGGLNYLKGNSKPYFSITVTCHRVGFPNQCESGGAAHEDIERYFPGKFTDLIALHLSDIDGAPMHAEANGWYKLAGVFGGADERFHVGNSKRHFPCAAPGDKPWQNTEYRFPTREECLEIFAEHCRVPILEARNFAEKLAPLTNPMRRAKWQAYCESLRPRWAEQAKACIAAHNLTVYGDPWPSAA